MPPSTSWRICTHLAPRLDTCWCLSRSSCCASKIRTLRGRTACRSTSRSRIEANRSGCRSSALSVFWASSSSSSWSLRRTPTPGSLDRSGSCSHSRSMRCTGGSVSCRPCDPFLEIGKPSSARCWNRPRSGSHWRSTRPRWRNATSSWSPRSDSIALVVGAGDGPREILVVEDDRSLRAAIARALTGAGFAVTEVGDGAAAITALRSAHPEVVLLDIGLPFVDGWRVLGQMHQGRQPSVIIISARGDEQDKVRALDMGADDSLAKPFGTEELLARIRAVLRRAQPPDHPPATVRANGIVVDLGARSAIREGAEVRLSPTEYLLLAELARHAHEVMEFRTLLQRVWGPTYAGERHYLRVFIQRLRRKLEKDPAHPAVILTVAGRGYRLGAVAER